MHAHAAFCAPAACVLCDARATHGQSVSHVSFVARAGSQPQPARTHPSDLSEAVPPTDRPLDTLKSLVVYFTPARTKLLLQTPDKTGREPLHIAAYKCTEEMVQYLMALGSANTRADTAGNTASKLAERAGRRKSREIIEGVPPAPAAP